MKKYTMEDFKNKRIDVLISGQEEAEIFLSMCGKSNIKVPEIVKEMMSSCLAYQSDILLYIDRNNEVNYLLVFNQANNIVSLDQLSLNNTKIQISADDEARVKGIISTNKVITKNYHSENEKDLKYELRKAARCLTAEKDKSIKVDSIVEVIDSGESYTTYASWFRNHNREDLVELYEYGTHKIPPHGEKYKVMHIGYHERDEFDLYAIQNLESSKIYLVNEDGIKLVEEYRPIIIDGKIEDIDKAVIGFDSHMSENGFEIMLEGFQKCLDELLESIDEYRREGIEGDELIQKVLYSNIKLEHMKKFFENCKYDW